MSISSSDWSNLLSSRRPGMPVPLDALFCSVLFCSIHSLIRSCRPHPPLTRPAMPLVPQAWSTQLETEQQAPVALLLACQLLALHATKQFILAPGKGVSSLVQALKPHMTEEAFQKVRHRPCPCRDQHKATSLVSVRLSTQHRQSCQCASEACGGLPLCD